MKSERWVVKTPTGERWGFLKQLIVDRATSRITYAEVVSDAGGQVVRIPWASAVIQDESIILDIPANSVQMA